MRTSNNFVEPEVCPYSVGLCKNYMKECPHKPSGGKAEKTIERYTMCGTYSRLIYRDHIFPVIEKVAKEVYKSLILKKQI